MKTYLFIDVDGVINSMSKNPPGRMTGWEDWAEVRVSPFDDDRSFRISYAKDLLRRIEAVAERDDVEPMWLTTWRESAPKQLCAGIELAGTEWLVVPDDGDEEDANINSWWKYTALRRYWESEDRTDQRFVWLDDDLRWVPDAMRWARDVGALCISPESVLGLTRKHIEAVEGFVGAR